MAMALLPSSSSSSCTFLSSQSQWGCLGLIRFPSDHSIFQVAGLLKTAQSLEKAEQNPDIFQKNVRNPNHHYFSKKYRNTPPICIAARLQFVLQSFWCPWALREIVSVLLPFVSHYASHLYCNTPPICIAVLLGKSWWLWSPGCSPTTSK